MQCLLPMEKNPKRVLTAIILIVILASLIAFAFQPMYLSNNMRWAQKKGKKKIKGKGEEIKDPV